MREEGADRWLTVIRDVLSMTVGAFGLIHAAVTKWDAPAHLVTAYLVLLGVPGVLSLIELRTSRQRRQQSSSQRPGSRPRSSTSSRMGDEFDD